MLLHPAEHCLESQDKFEYWSVVFYLTFYNTEGKAAKLNISSKSTSICITADAFK